ncbi:MAG: hypothetical protein J6K69_06590 [Candidatus Methanomethylophilaceae archaeon]|nr:hypothetical protein [Candidatus Methanomethylophilaceae archaeon]MBR2348241.1 hypothetical protein [Candidatus Methanomethylophilaceae archaeon]
MSNDDSFNEIVADLSAGRTDEVSSKSIALAEETDDPFTIVKCISLLKVANDKETISKLIDILMTKVPEEYNPRVEIAGALRGLEYPHKAYEILKGMEGEDPLVRIKSICLAEMEEYEMALSCVTGIKEQTVGDRVLMVDIYSSLGEHSAANKIAESLIGEFPKEYVVMRCYVTALILAGRDKEAVKFVRSCLKDKSADSNAIAAYVMRITGNIKAAAGYATRAIQIDNGHVGAMETLGICLAEKGEIDKARIVAGAINEKSPGDKAALNVLSYCDRD